MRYQLVTALCLSLTATMTSRTVSAQAVSVSLVVTDPGERAPVPLPGVMVRVLDAQGRELEKGPTDGKGVYVARKVSVGQSITFEYELAGYVRRPERLSWKVKGPTDRAAGTLLSKNNDTYSYLQRIAQIIDAIADAASTATAKKANYTNEWDRVVLLPKDSQMVISKEIVGKQYLADQQTFKDALEAADKN